MKEHQVINSIQEIRRYSDYLSTFDASVDNVDIVIRIITFERSVVSTFENREQSS